MSSATVGRFSVSGHTVFAPTLGKVVLVAANLAVLLTLCFYGLEPGNYASFENIGYRTGRITACQLPLLFLLAGKRNIVGYLVGCSYERINWLHRWAARCMLVTTTLHMGYWFYGWGRYDYISTRIATDVMAQQGIAAWAILAWITFSSVAPIRGWRYEWFLVQHIVSFAGLVGAIYIHITPTDVEFVWISVGVFFFDRFFRAGSYMYNNMFRKLEGSSTARSFWGSQAEFAALPGGHTRVTIEAPRGSWKPGQHAFLSCQALVPLQAHPFTICSIPSDGKMEFIVQSRTGGTRRLNCYAQRLLPGNRPDTLSCKHVAIEGPYGNIRPLQQFDSVVLYAGGVGATFTVPLLRDLVHSWKSQKSVVTRRARFVWVIKSGQHLEWFRTRLNETLQDVADLRARGQDVQLKVTLYVTCDESFTLQHGAIVSDDSKVACDPIVDRVIINTEKTKTLIVEEAEETNHSNCCCRHEAVEDDEMPAPVCNCGPGCGAASGSVSLTDAKEDEKTSASGLHPELHIFSGRPPIEEITRTSLEQALGESAVVACGPRGLTHDVRSTTVYLSDSRAVHKGTGAQGIWLHTEAFGY